MKARIIFHLAAVVVLTATVAAAQSPKDKANPAQTSTSQERQQSVPSVSEREASTGMASGRRQHQPVTITAREASSGMATGRKTDSQDHESNSPSAFESGVTTAREASSGMATGRRSGSIVVLEHDSVTTAREASSGMATGRQVSGDPHEYVNSRNSAHATESLDAGSKDAAKMSKAQSNPMYKDSGMQGTNPLYQGKDKTAAPPSGGNGSKPAGNTKTARMARAIPAPGTTSRRSNVSLSDGNPPPTRGGLSVLAFHFRGSVPRPGCIYSNFRKRCTGYDGAGRLTLNLPVGPRSDGACCS